MKIEGIQDKLEKYIKIAEKFTSKNPTLPVLSCLYFEVKKEKLLIRATNLDIGFEIEIPVKVKEEGVVSVPSSLVSNFIQTLKQDKNINLETKNGNITISGQKTSALIKCLPSEDFPTIPYLITDKKFKINSNDFILGLKSVYYSSSISTIKPELASVYIYKNEDFLVFCATDSFRLSEKKIRIKNLDGINENILIPAKNIPQIISTLELINDVVEVLIGNGQVSFVYNNLYFTSRIIEGNFPDYKQIIPKEFKTDVVVLKQDFVNALKRTVIFSDTFNNIVLKIDPSKKNLSISTKSGELGENENNIDAVIKGDSLDIRFNYKYIMDCFQSINTDSVSLKFLTQHQPMVIKGVSDQSFTYLVMPMNK